MRVASPSVPERANRVLNIILFAMVLILLRVWHVSVVQHDAKVEEARRPQRRARVERAERGTIRDRFNVPMAVNRVQYNAAVSYAQVREVPRRERREYVERLAKLLAGELGMEVERIEDLIYSRAALFPNVPYVVKADVGEETYYRLRMLEKDWLGVCAERVPRRVYPQGRVAGDILGYMGPISREEYGAVAEELACLTEYVKGCERGQPTVPPKGVASFDEARRRLAELKERSYSIHDSVGKAGVEGLLDEQLRGFCGRRIFLQDPVGTYLRELPGGKEAVAGQRVLLTLSAELQEFAEELLAQNERVRDGRSHYFDRERGVYVPLKQPWIKGGAIVALDPNTGEVLALASYPRTDPNSFVATGDPERERERQMEIVRWFETDGYVGQVWDGRRPLERETVGGEELCDLTWERYLQFVLSEESAVHAMLPETVAGAVAMQELEEEEYERMLAVDLCKVAVDGRRFDGELLLAVGEQRIADYREANRAANVMEGVVRELAREKFHEAAFRPWREEHGKAFLKQKRREERERGTYQRPYLDYLDAEEKNQFAEFWEEVRWSMVMLFVAGRCLPCGVPLSPYLSLFGSWADELKGGAHRGEPWHTAYRELSRALAPLTPRVAVAYLQTMRRFEELDRPLLGRYRYLRGKRGAQTERDLAAAFYPRYGFGYGRSYAYRQAAPQGSVFKVVTSYATLMRRYDKLMAEGRSLSQLSPFTMVDDVHKDREKRDQWNVGFTAGGKAIPQRYKGGRLLRTHRRNAGEIDLIGALEVSSNSYFGIAAGEHLDGPEDLIGAASALSYGQRTGIELPGEYPGRFPNDVDFNKTGLYCFACGQHEFSVTPLQTAVMLAGLANGGTIFEPQVVGLLAGREPVREGSKMFADRRYPFQESLSLLGVDFPLFTSAGLNAHTGHIERLEPRVRRNVRLPHEVRQMLFKGMQAVVSGERGGALPSRMRAYYDYPWMKADYRALHKQFIGKTGTAEAVENIDLDQVHGTNTYNHIWFGAISYEEGEIAEGYFGRPELVVVVYLRYGDYGPQAAPVAAQIIKKWREIRTAHVG
jgi:cell division protein FtsI/penicillin-binding protein 2